MQQYFSFTNSHYSLIQQDQPTASTRWGGYWVDIWGKVGAKRDSNRAAGSSKAYQLARKLQLHFRKTSCVKIDHKQYTYVYIADDEMTRTSNA